MEAQLEAQVEHRNAAAGVVSWSPRRIAILAAAVSALVGGAASLAAQSDAVEPKAFQRDRLANYEAAGCRQVELVIKSGWMCMRP